MKDPGNWNPIESDIVSKSYAGVTLQVWLALLIINPNKAGVFSLFPFDLQSIVSKLRDKKTKRADIEAALKDIESKGWIKRYPDNVVWIKDRWNYVGNKDNQNTIKNAKSFVAPYPTVWEDFKQHYGLQCQSEKKDSVYNTVTDSVSNSVGNKGKEKGKEEERKEYAPDKSDAVIPEKTNGEIKKESWMKTITDAYSKCYTDAFGVSQEKINREFDWKVIGKRCRELKEHYEPEEIARAIEYMFKNHDDCWSKNLPTFQSLVTKSLISRAIGKMRNPDAGEKKYCV